ncbi:MAG: sigma-54 dependent transcriptional regulator [Phycisphaerae bacterium]|nr:sigma-54 dependent transcriptional regulator [Phycisphaerae bacterium]
MARVLVVDDKEMMRDSVTTTLARRGHTAVACYSGKQAVERIGERVPDLIITDLQMPDMNGLELLQEVRKVDEQLPVIMMTAFGTVETAVQAMKLGAFDYVTKPFSGDQLTIAVDRALDHARLQRENQILRANAAPAGRPSTVDMVGSGPSMSALKEELARIANSHSTVLIAGESGTGKEVAARLIHAMSPRAAAPFMAINCAALSANLLESELFGHEKGAFTGADRLRKGRFELAEGGTLLLDEISEIAPELQAKLLRVLQERTFERVGSSSSRATDVRVIATSNRNLTGEVDKGRFRGDLYFRLNVLPVTMPALRDRVEDVPELATYFLGLVAAREGRRPRAFTHDAVAVLKTYSWPGNVRELQNICERAAVLAMNDSIEGTLIRPWLIGAAAPAITTEAPAASVTTGSTGGGVTSPLSTASHQAGLTSPVPMAVASSTSLIPRIACDGHQVTLEILERETILTTLERNRGHRVRSAKDLGIGVRTLGLKLKKWKEEARIPQEI